MTIRQEKRDARAAHSDPINFTCGKCRKVHPFDADDPYACPDEVEPDGE